MVMKERTTEAMLTLFAVLVGAMIGVLIIASVAYAAEVCPEEGKVESVVDGDIDGIVLDAGTEVCIKGGQTLVTVTADGESTLAELLGTGQNVSHYTVLEVPPSETTTTTTAPSTTTSSTLIVTPTTAPSTTTTTQEASSSTTTVVSSTTTPSNPPTTSTPTESTPNEELPFTGVPGGVLLATASLLLAGGVATLIRERLTSE